MQIKNKQVYNLLLIHISIITLSNVLVQYPFLLFGLHTTWGAFSYPLIFITTDLTTRLCGPKRARQVIFLAMIPGFIISYLLAVVFSHGIYQGIDALLTWHALPFRVALACFSAYLLGQLLDIGIFQRLRQHYKAWWLAPAVSSSLGNMIDTLVFFSIAFYQCSNPILSTHWPEIALVDFSVKTLMTIVCFVPLYGLVLKLLMNKALPSLRAYSRGNPVQ